MKREPNSIALAFFLPLFCLLLSTSFILRLRLKGPKSTGLLATTCGTAGRREQPFALGIGSLWDPVKTQPKSSEVVLSKWAVAPTCSRQPLVPEGVAKGGCLRSG